MKCQNMVLTDINRGEHSLSLGGFAGGGRAVGVSSMLPILSRTNISESCILSFWTPDGAMTIFSPACKVCKVLTAAQSDLRNQFDSRRSLVLIIALP